MMKRILLVVMLVMFAALPASAVNVDTHISGNTVSFNTVNEAVNCYAQIVSFNSVTKHIRLQNLSTIDDCYADLVCRDANGIPGFATRDTCTVLLPAIGSATPNTVELDFATHNIAFSSDTANGNFGRDNVHYDVMGEVADF